LEEPTASCHLPRTAADRAAPGRSAFGTAPARALRAQILACELNRLLGPFGDLVERQVHRGFKIVAACGPGPPGPPATAHPEKISKVAKAENILKDAADILPSHMRVVTHTNAAKTLVTELVIALPFFRVAQYLVGLGALFELDLSFGLVVGVFVGMVFYRHPSVGALYLLTRGVFAHPQNFIVITFGHRLVLSISSPAGKGCTRDQRLSDCAG